MGSKTAIFLHKFLNDIMFEFEVKHLEYPALALLKKVKSMLDSKIKIHIN
jgi:hypothetical protein